MPDGVRVAVNVTGEPNVEGLGEAASTVVVVVEVGAVTVIVIVFEYNKGESALVAA
jgi:hypothetical protein